MILLRSALFVCLAVVVALTSVALGQARGQMRMGDRVVICSGAGPVTIEIDAQGNPVGPGHVCPDCALSVMAAQPVARAEPVAPDAMRLAQPALHTAMQIGQAGPQTLRARGPPRPQA